MPNCKKCNRSFATRRSLDQHLSSAAHRPSYYCNDCDRSFGSHHALRQHLNSSIHSPSYLCRQCNRYFWTNAALNAHRANSPAHTRKTQCIGAGCSRHFGSWSAMIQHWESGACRSGITRSLVDNIVSIDGTNLFSAGGGQLLLPPVEEERIVELPDDEDEELSGAGAPTPNTTASASSSVVILTPVTEPSAFQTPGSAATIFTPGTPMPGSSSGVNPQTLAERLERLSPRVIQIPPIYFCPFPSCPSGKVFSSLSGLFQHMESRGCRGHPGKFAKQFLKQFKLLK
ncbi:hypothetical protein BDZ91DRAFT_765282 [Kalaharituber pfeilii]|nr:hypothetical protein BDZ91DRAFT_765282 [Kalaharituber pfeilii]